MARIVSKSINCRFIETPQNVIANYFLWIVLERFSKFTAKKHFVFVVLGRLKTQLSYMETEWFWGVLFDLVGVEGIVCEAVPQ